MAQESARTAIEKDELAQLLDEYRRDTMREMSSKEREVAYRHWLAVLTEAEARNPGSRWVRGAQIDRLSLANALEEFELSQSILSDLIATAPNVEDRINWYYELGSITMSMFVVSGRPEEARKAIATFAQAGRLFRELEQELPAAPVSHALARRYVVGSFDHAKLLIEFGNKPLEAAELLIEADDWLKLRFPVGTMDEAARTTYDSLVRSRYGRETFLSGAMKALGAAGEVDRATNIFQELKELDDLREPVSRHLLQLASSSYPEGGKAYQKLLKDWSAAQSPSTEGRPDVLYALAKDQADHADPEGASGTLEWMLADYGSQMNSDPRIKAFIREGYFNLATAYEQYNKGPQAEQALEKFRSLADPSDKRVSNGGQGLQVE